MALKALRPCKHSGCAELTRDGWCDRHKPRHKRNRSADYHSWYFLPIWTKTLRPNQLLKEPFCRECAREGLRVYATVVDHIVPHRGDWKLFCDPNNLQSLCKHHHDKKTMQERADFQR